MFIKTVEKIPLSVINTLQGNPLTKDLARFEKDIALGERRISHIETSLNTLTAELDITKQLKRINEKKAVKLRKILDQNTVYTPELPALFDLEKLEKFFNNNGMCFVSLSFIEHENCAYLSFIRPCRMIGSLPTPPLFIRMKYAIDEESDSSILRLSYYDITARTNINYENGYIHPHLNGSTICLGNYKDVLDKNGVPIEISSYQDHVILLDNLLSTYNSSSPYRAIHDIIIASTKRTTFDVEFAPTIIDNSITIANDTINAGKFIIPKTMYEEYFEKLNSISLIDILDDVVAFLRVQYADGPSSDREFLVEIFDRISELCDGDIDLDLVNDYEEYDEFDDALVVYSGAFESIIESWCETILAFIKDSENKDRTISFENLPDLEAIYEEEESCI